VKLYPYQVTGAKWVAARRAAGLADDAGLGKTAQALDAARQIGATSIVVACPAVARNVWRNEVKTWLPNAGGLSIDIRSYDELAANQDLRRSWAASRPDVLICDEAHYLKSRDARRTKSIYGPGCTGDRGISAACGATWLLTATPTPNHPGEMWSHLRALRPDLIESAGAPMNYHTFLTHHCETRVTEYGITPTKLRRPEMTRALAREFWLRRVWQDVLTELPDWTWQHVPIDCEDTRAALAEWEKLHPEVGQLVDELDAHGAAGPLAAYLASYRHWVGSIKAPAVAALLKDELASKAMDKVVVFAHHHDAINTIHAALEDFGPVQITGHTTDTARARAIDRFQTDRGCRAMVCQTQAAGVAITLTAARHVVFAEPEWVPADMYQAAKRVHRIGQKCPVLVRVIGLAGSLDDRVAAVAARKARMTDSIFNEVTK
jgi:SWI/SNF-related matrix-associated actin-dependent regulator of chromatin subfamily A-like protein 1